MEGSHKFLLGHAAFHHIDAFFALKFSLADDRLIYDFGVPFTFIKILKA